MKIRLWEILLETVLNTSFGIDDMFLLPIS